MTREALGKLGLSLNGARVVVQGFGNVGRWAARILSRMDPRIVAVSDLEGGIYDAEGLETSSKWPRGRILSYKYGDTTSRRSRGNVTEIKVTPDLRGPNGSEASLATTVQYHGRTNLPTLITDPRKGVTTIERLRTGRPAKIDEPEGRTTKYEYNPFGQVTKVTNPNDHVNEYHYFDEGDSEGYLERVVVDPGELKLTTKYETDARGNVTAVIDPRNVRHEQVFNELDWRSG